MRNKPHSPIAGNLSYEEQVTCGYATPKCGDCKGLGHLARDPDGELIYCPCVEKNVGSKGKVEELGEKLSKVEEQFLDHVAQQIKAKRRCLVAIFENNDGGMEIESPLDGASVEFVLSTLTRSITRDNALVNSRKSHKSKILSPITEKPIIKTYN